VKIKNRNSSLGVEVKKRKNEELFSQHHTHDDDLWMGNADKLGTK